MGNLSDKAAYLKGLYDGMELDEKSKETKLLKAVIDAVSDIADAVDRQDEDIDDIVDEILDVEDHVNAVDLDLGDDEECLFGDADCENCSDYGCRYRDDGEDDYDENDEDDGDSLYEVICPDCGKTFYFTDEDIEDGSPVTCPFCGCVIDDIQLTDPDSDGE
jgi:predicted Zn-dependent protease with MMP-like domain